VEVLKMAVEVPKLAVKLPKPGVEVPKPAVELLKLGVELPNLGLERDYRDHVILWVKSTGCKQGVGLQVRNFPPPEYASRFLC
jgi:hypothetical protein